VGTGFIVTHDGIICTCFHVIGENEHNIYENIQVYFPQTKQTVPVTILTEENRKRQYIDPINDIAFLKLSKDD
jgi:hypothetical protein